MLMDSDFKVLSEMNLEELQEKRRSVAYGIASSKEELKRIQSRLAELHTEEKELKEKERSLTGGPWGGRGDIAFLEAHLATVDRFIEDHTKPKVYFANSKRLSEGSWIVGKVTPKRIFVREKGHERVDLYNHDGTPVSSYGNTIDIAKTFPDGLKVTK